MSAAEINREMDRLRKQESAFCDEMIAAGRGYERPGEWLKKDDELSLRGRTISDRRSALQVEIHVRYGSQAPSPLPTGKKHGPPQERILNKIV